MGTNEFTGMLITGLAAVASLFVILLKCIKPINDLNLNIVKLTAAIDRLIDNDKVQDSRIAAHGKNIDNLNIHVENHEGRIKNLERRCNDIRGG